MRRLRRFLIRLAASATGRRDDERLREELEDHIAFQHRRLYCVESPESWSDVKIW